jgi:glycosyltransferase involved in cell wall biosynthesis
VQTRRDILKLSCCIPTFNRSRSLARAIRSLCNQTLEPGSCEILIVDNGSSDNTRGETESLMREMPHHRIRYLLEPEPGLLSGRHRGALESDGEILVFLDDDIEATAGYLHAILDAFKDPAVQLVGGPNLPRYESEPPAWIESFWSTTPYGGRMCGFLSLLDLGGNAIEIHPNYIWGLNFAIRRRALFDLGGFHPDCIPDALQCFQGDGETGLTMKAFAQGYKAVFTPGATVYHFIPTSRMTTEYFERRAYYQGICDSYSMVRRDGRVTKVQWHLGIASQFRRTRELAGAALRQTKRLYVGEFRRMVAITQREISPVNDTRSVAIQQRIQRAYEAGFDFHRDAVSRNPELLAWVLRSDYWDYHLPLFKDQSKQIVS